MATTGPNADEHFEVGVYGTPVELVGRAQLETRVHELAEVIDNRFGAGPILMLGVLTGAYMFLADLSRRLTTPHEIAFVRAASYGGRGAVPSETVELSGLEPSELAHRHVLIIEDLIDSGHTLRDLVDAAHDAGAASVTSCVLVAKQRTRDHDIEPDLVGFEVPNVFVVGYGIDYRGAWRQLPYIGYVEVPE